MGNSQSAHPFIPRRSSSLAPLVTVTIAKILTRILEYAPDVQHLLAQRLVCRKWMRYCHLEIHLRSICILMHRPGIPEPMVLYCYQKSRCGSFGNTMWAPMPLLARFSTRKSDEFRPASIQEQVDGDGRRSAPLNGFIALNGCDEAVLQHCSLSLCIPGKQRSRTVPIKVAVWHQDRLDDGIMCAYSSNALLRFQGGKLASVLLNMSGLIASQGFSDTPRTCLYSLSRMSRLKSLSQRDSLEIGLDHILGDTLILDLLSCSANDMPLYLVPLLERLNGGGVASRVLAFIETLALEVNIVCVSIPPAKLKALQENQLDQMKVCMSQRRGSKTVKETRRNRPLLDGIRARGVWLEEKYKQVVESFSSLRGAQMFLEMTGLGECFPWKSSRYREIYMHLARVLPPQRRLQNREVIWLN
ncbi:MAG: hypothetical protein SGCHY_004048 [Lobulomycetales sp.]